MALAGVDRVMSRLAPPLFLAGTAAATAAALVSVSQSQARLALGRALAAGCLGAAIAVTLMVNEPVNARLRAWRPQDETPAGWRADRARWDRGHAGRRALVAAAAAASLWGRSGPAAGRAQSSMSLVVKLAQAARLNTTR